MNWDRIAGTWQQLAEAAMQQWGRLTGDRAGAVARKANEKQLAEWLERQHKVDPIHK